MAGKKAKCGCGAVILVPPAPTLIPGQFTPKNERPPKLTPAALAAQPQFVKPSIALGYVSDRRKGEPLAIDKLIDPVRDIYLPTGLVAFGFIAILVWALLARGISAHMSMVVLIASSVSTTIKTTLLVLIAVAIAKKAGLGFGTFWTAVLKFGSIILLSDSMLIWFETWMIHAGAIRVSRGVMHISIGLLVLELFLVAFLIAGLLKYYFDMDHDEVLYIGLGIAFVSMVTGFVLRFLLIAALEAIIVARRPAVAPAPSPPPAPAAIAPAAPLNETPHDKEIRLLIEQQLSEYRMDNPGMSGSGPFGGRGRRRMFEALVGAGVKGMYTDVEGDKSNFLYLVQSQIGPTVYVELPQNSAGRAACFTAYSEYCNDNRVKEDPAEAKDTGQKYMVIQLKK